MANKESDAKFQSAFAPLMEQFVQEKRACGYRYCASARTLANFDRFLSDQAIDSGDLPWSITGKWLSKRPHESASTHRDRISVVRQFTLFLCRQGYRADVPNELLGAKKEVEFSPPNPDTRRGRKTASGSRSAHTDRTFPATPYHHA